MSKIIYQMVTDRIIDALKKGHVPWQKPWKRLGGIPVLPCNLASRKEYNGVNAILLAFEAVMNAYDLPVWLTLKQANAMGGGIKKGSGSLPVVFWKQWHKPVDGASDRPGRPSVEDADALVRGARTEATGPAATRDADFESIPVLRYYGVFNAAQTFGVKQVEALQARIAQQLQTRPFVPLDEAESIFQAAKEHLGCRFFESGNKAAYLPHSDNIMMPHRETFASPAHFYVSLFHEMVHATGHKDRLKRAGFQAFRPGSKPEATPEERYAKEELVAEIGACYLANKAGLIDDTLFTNSASYLQSWMKRLGDDPKLIISASSQAMRAVEFLLHGKQVQVDVVQSAAAADEELKEESESVKV